MELRLKAELVPQTSWYNNLRKVIAREDWDVLRHDVYAQYDHHCGVCQAQVPLQCHEIWQYDDVHHLQTLRGFIALCEMCHHVKHLGLAGLLASQGKLDYTAVVTHFCRVNQCDRRVFKAHEAEVFATWEKRSRHKWTVDLGEWADLVR